MKGGFFLVCLFCSVLSSVHLSQSSVIDHDVLRQLIQRVSDLESRDQQHQQDINALRDTVKKQTEEISKLKNSGNGENTDELSISPVQRRFRRAGTGVNIAFFAKLTATVTHLGLGQNVVFDDVITNIGNGYNNNVGIFTAPLPGTYVFSTTITTHGRSSTHYGFFVNGKQITVIFVNGNDSPWESSSETIVVELNKGDDVEVRHTESNRDIQGQGHTTFAGFLLAEGDPSPSVVG